MFEIFRIICSTVIIYRLSTKHIPSLSPVVYYVQYVLVGPVVRFSCNELPLVENAGVDVLVSGCMS